MKFKDPKTGEVFGDICSAWRKWRCPRPGDCTSEYIEICEHWNKTCSLAWTEDNPAEAARLMGYEVVEDETVTKCNDLYDEVGGEIMPEKEANMEKVNDAAGGKEAGLGHKQKSLKDWTLGEVHGYCKKRNDHHRAEHENFQNVCFGYWFLSMCQSDADRWDLTEKPRFTEEEVADARAIMRIVYLVWDDVVRDITGELSLKNKAGNRMPIQHSLFPSILPGQSVKLSDIVGGE